MRTPSDAPRTSKICERKTQSHSSCRPFRTAPKPRSGRRTGWRFCYSTEGGLALAFCQYPNETGLPLPSQMILLSPWPDVSMDTPFAPRIDKADPNLQYDILKIAGQNWAGTHDVHDYRVSHIYRDLTSLPQ